MLTEGRATRAVALGNTEAPRFRRRRPLHESVGGRHTRPATPTAAARRVAPTTVLAGARRVSGRVPAGGGGSGVARGTLPDRLERFKLEHGAQQWQRQFGGGYGTMHGSVGGTGEECATVGHKDNTTQCRPHNGNHRITGEDRMENHKFVWTACLVQQCVPLHWTVITPTHCR